MIFETKVFGIFIAGCVLLMSFIAFQASKLLHKTTCQLPLENFVKSPLMEKIEKKNWKGGRKKLPEKEIRKRYYLYLNNDEFQQIKQMQIQLGYKKFSQIMRYILLKRSKNFVIAGSVDVIKHSPHQNPINSSG